MLYQKIAGTVSLAGGSFFRPAPALENGLRLRHTLRVASTL